MVEVSPAYVDSMVTRMWLVGVTLVLLTLEGAEPATLFNGNFNQYTTNTDFDSWSFSNQGNWPYQTYIYGTTNPPSHMSSFVELSKDYRAPIDSSANQGIRVKINGSSFWNGQTMERTELVARLDQTIYSNTKYFHFSLAQDPTYPLNANYEHQIMFFEAHFADIKFGGSYGNQLQFTTSSQPSGWKADFGSNEWHNFAIEVDFTGQKVALYHSVGTSALQQVVGPTSSSPSNSEWHVGMLRLPNNGQNDPTQEYLYVSSVYVADALMSFTPVSNTATIGSGGSSSSSGSGSSANSGGMSGAGKAVLSIFIIFFVVCILAGIFYYKRGHICGIKYTRKQGIHRDITNVIIDESIRERGTNYTAFVDDEL